MYQVITPHCPAPLDLVHCMFGRGVTRVWTWSSPIGTLWPQKWPIMHPSSTSRYTAAAKTAKNAAVEYRMVHGSRKNGSKCIRCVP